MKIIRNIVLNNVIITVIMISHINITLTGNDSWFPKFWDPAGTAAIKEAGTFMETHGDKILGLADTAKETTEVAGHALVEASAQAGIESTKELAKVMSEATKTVETLGKAGIAVAGAGVAIYGVAKFYPMLQDFLRYKYPTENAQMSEMIAKQKRQMIEKEMNFRNCLIDNRLSDRGCLGIPTVCESTAEAFAMMGQRAEVDQTIACFNRFRDGR